MTTKTVPLSVRVSDEDATFLAELEFAGAKTPSDKLRTILARERRRHEGTQDPEAATHLVEDMLRPAERRVSRLEADGTRSELVHRAYARLPELTGLLLAGPASGGETAEELAHFEARIARLYAGMARDFMELALFSREKCYDARVIGQHIPALVELVELLKISSERRKDAS